MNPSRRSYVEHVAVRVRDIHWHVRFFREVLGMTVREVDGPADAPRQLWTIGGMQLVADPGFKGPEGRLAHLGVMTDDLEDALDRAYRWEGVKQLPQGRHWLELPDGLCVELIQARNDAVARALAIDPRAGTPDSGPPKVVTTGHERYWDDAKEGDEGLTPSVTVTGEMIDTYADVSGDRTPLHVDEEYARRSHFGERVAHGLFGLAVADGLKCQADYRFLPGMSLGWNWDFLLPIRIGDTLHVKFRVGSLRPSKSKPGWGIVIVPCELINQKGEVVQRGEHKLMIPRRPAVAGA